MRCGNGKQVSQSLRVTCSEIRKDLSTLHSSTEPNSRVMFSRTSSVVNFMTALVKGPTAEAGRMDLNISTPMHMSIETVAWMALHSNIDFNMSSITSCHVMHVQSNHIWIYRRFAIKEKNQIYKKTRIRRTCRFWT